MFRVVSGDFCGVAFPVEDHVDGFEPVRHGGDVRGEKFRGGERIPRHPERTLVGKNGFRVLVVNLVAGGAGIADGDFCSVGVFIRLEEVFHVDQGGGKLVQQLPV